VISASNSPIRRAAALAARFASRLFDFNAAFAPSSFSICARNSPLLGGGILTANLRGYRFRGSSHCRLLWPSHATPRSLHRQRMLADRGSSGHQRIIPPLDSQAGRERLVSLGCFHARERRHAPGVTPTTRSNTRPKWLWSAKPHANAASASGVELPLNRSLARATRR
jgi:hypothetical protein